MAFVPITGINLSMLADGYGGKVIDKVLTAVQEDIIDRGRDGKTRKATFTITFDPLDDNRCEVGIEANYTLPKFRPAPTIAKFDKHAGGLMFSTDCSDNPEQAAIPGAGVDD